MENPAPTKANNEYDLSVCLEKVLSRKGSLSRTFEGHKVHLVAQVF